MMMAQQSEMAQEPRHTPGPWRLVDGDATGFKTHSGGESILADARPSDDFFILKIAEMDTNVPAAERVANAHLISAAPDLYEASRAAWPANLLQVPDHLADDFVFPVDVTAGELRAIRAALSKAEGKS